MQMAFFLKQIIIILILIILFVKIRLNSFFYELFFFQLTLFYDIRAN
jgi:hypothetical protein